MPVRKLIAVSLLIVCQTLFYPVYAKVVHLKNGTALEGLQVEVDGDYLRLAVSGGSTRIPKTLLAEDSLREFFPDDPLLKPAPPKEPARGTWKNYRNVSPSATGTTAQSTPSPVPSVSASSQPVASPTVAVSPLEKALIRAGENRPELEQALAQSNTPEMKLLITSAPPYDLVNITAEHLLNTVNYYLKVKKETVWGNGKELDEKLWMEYVLPYRITDEDLDDWRKEFYETLAPLVANCTDTKEAALIAHKWLYKGNTGGTAFMKFTPGSGEYRDMAPRQLLKTKEGKCFEMNLLMIALLRSIGVPARFVVIPYWTGQTDLYHSWVEYWDSQNAKWGHLDAGANPDWLMANSQSYSVVYALPGFPTERDLHGRERWELMENITASYTKPALLKVTAAGSTVKPICYTVYTFNYGTWRTVAQQYSAQRSGEVVFELADNTKVYPYLVSAAVDGKLVWDTVKVIAGRETELYLHEQVAENIFQFPQKTK
ncbi:MAG: transglutaminase domain-containing protein [Verrucomicrobiales bacterium]|nr:transglutaminase domain-containing protein [Verrucomicrobiales bacterium]